MAYEIEDRRKAREGVFGRGAYIVWQVVKEPFPCRLYRGKFETTKAAREFIAKERER